MMILGIICLDFLAQLGGLFVLVDDPEFDLPVQTHAVNRPALTISRRHVLQVAVAGGLASAIGLPGVSTAASDGTLVLATHRTPSDLDAHSAYDAGSRIVLQGMFETLIQVEPGTTDHYQPVIAESWEPNADHSIWTFHIRDGVTFQDGSPVDAKAVKASFARLLALRLGPSTVAGRFVQDAAQIAVPDARTVIFDLDRPAPLFEAAIASATVSAIVNVELALRHEVESDWGHAWALTMTEGLGTGPYRVTQFDLVEGIEFDRHEAYWRGWDGDHFDRVIMRIVGEATTRQELVERGDVDIVDSLTPNTLNALAANPDLVLDLRYDLATRYIMFNNSGPLLTPSARQALCWAFPYNDVIEGVYEGYAKRAIGPCAELCRGFAPDTFVFDTDLEQSKLLLDQAGVPQGTTLSIVIPVGVPLVDSIAQLLGANLEKVGLQLDIQYIDFATFVSIYFGDLPLEERPNLMPAFWSPDYNDGWNHLWPQLSSAAWNLGNAGHYANQQVDSLLDEARDAVDSFTYDRALKEVQQIVTKDDPAAIYYAQEQWPTILRKSIGGFIPNLISAELYDFYALHRLPV
jgi:peptide/nickel transport system substrate-binding protein